MLSRNINSCCGPNRFRTHPFKDPDPVITTSNNDSIKGMVLLGGGEFFMGTNNKFGFPSDGEGPRRRVKVKPIYVDVCVVSNSQFTDFVEDSGYRTEAEVYGSSFVFFDFIPRRYKGSLGKTVRNAPWWVVMDGAWWREPEGTGSSLDDRMDHPVVHISWNDAVAYSQWSEKRLPTESEWEYAALGGLEKTIYSWGDDLTPDGEYMCNIWQGEFPRLNTKEDGYAGTAPVDSFSENGYGLYNVCGNVWEWCYDWFSATYHKNARRDNPKGPKTGNAKVLKGGSYLCHESYCNRYRVAARTSNTPDSSSGHQGFRCVKDV